MRLMIDGVATKMSDIVAGSAKDGASQKLDEIKIGLARILQVSLSEFCVDASLSLTFLLLPSLSVNVLASSDTFCLTQAVYDTLGSVRPRPSRRAGDDAATNASSAGRSGCCCCDGCDARAVGRDQKAERRTPVHLGWRRRMESSSTGYARHQREFKGPGGRSSRRYSSSTEEETDRLASIPCL